MVLDFDLRDSSLRGVGIQEKLQDVAGPNHTLNDVAERPTTGKAALSYGQSYVRTSVRRSIWPYYPQHWL